MLNELLKKPLGFLTVLRHKAENRAFFLAHEKLTFRRYVVFTKDDRDVRQHTVTCYCSSGYQRHKLTTSSKTHQLHM